MQVSVEQFHHNLRVVNTQLTQVITPISICAEPPKDGRITPETCTLNKQTKESVSSWCCFIKITYVFKIYLENNICVNLIHATEKHVVNIKIVSRDVHYNYQDDHHYMHTGLNAHVWVAGRP
jgi:hypothetical protein